MPTIPTPEHVITPTIPEPVVTPIPTPDPIMTPIIIPQSTINKTIALTLENLSDIAQHFITQNNLVFTLVSKTPLTLGETALLTLEIHDKDGNPYSGLLPFAFTVLSNNDILQPDVSNIQMINNGTMDIAIIGQKI